MEIPTSVRDIVRTRLQDSLSHEEEALLDKLQVVHDRFRAVLDDFSKQMIDRALIMTYVDRVDGHQLRVKCYQDWSAQLKVCMLKCRQQSSSVEEPRQHERDCGCSDCELNQCLDGFKIITEDFIRGIGRDRESDEDISDFTFPGFLSSMPAVDTIVSSDLPSTTTRERISTTSGEADVLFEGGKKRVNSTFQSEWLGLKKHKRAAVTMSGEIADRNDGGFEEKRDSLSPSSSIAATPTTDSSNDSSIVHQYMMDRAVIEKVDYSLSMEARNEFSIASADDVGTRVCTLCHLYLTDNPLRLAQHLERIHPDALLQLIHSRPRSQQDFQLSEYVHLPRIDNATNIMTNVFPCPETDDDADMSAANATPSDLKEEPHHNPVPKHLPAQLQITASINDQLRMMEKAVDQRSHLSVYRSLVKRLILICGGNERISGSIFRMVKRLQSPVSMFQLNTKQAQCCCGELLHFILCMATTPI